MSMAYQDVSALFKALAHPVRLQILDMLCQSEICVCQMETALGKRQAYVSQQLMILRDANLIVARRDGRQVFYRIADDTLYVLLAVMLGLVKGEPDILADCPTTNCATEYEVDMHT